MWTLSFQVIEHFIEDFNDSDFGTSIFDLSINVLTSEDDSIQLKEIVSSGLERLLMTEVFAIKQANVIMTTVLEQLKSSSGKSDLTHCIKLMVTCIYVFGISIGDGDNDGDDTSKVASSSPEPEQEMSGSKMKTSASREDLVTAMEKVSVLFDRLRVTMSRRESLIISKLVPSTLTDFFPPQDSLNKVIGELLSNVHNQLHPNLLAQVIFDTFDKFLSSNQSDIVHDWVLLSLASFVQLDPIETAIWYLNVFLLSASSNKWIKSM